MEKKAGAAHKKRIISIDYLRGIVIVLMALDHIREFFTSVRFSPTDLSQTSAALFFTRWITHFCAPAFVFLAGTGAFLYGNRGRSKSEISRFLFTRGLFLIFLEFTVIRFVVTFNLNYFSPGSTVAQVIWVIGLSMVMLAALVFLSDWLIALFGIGLILAHNFFDTVTVVPAFEWLWIILHKPGLLALPLGLEVKLVYPVVPWVGVMALGYVFGNIVALGEVKRRKVFFWLGLGLVLAFLIIRCINIYGDPACWASQGSFLFTVLSFLNCTKYPPSLLYLLMTLGPAILVLSFFSEKDTPLSKFFVTFGRVSLFFYILHFFTMHIVAVILAMLRYQIIPHWLFVNNPVFSRPPFPSGPTNYGYDLIVVYLVWVAVTLLLYPACRWYMKYKASHAYPWLSYL
ncbi:MAG: DUF1624 domain-containing protein [Candidatus Omnitrophica bacterium]|nr:DUF1624 domain-containing protein [Candidatus Omnitrophota bacterium]